MRDPDARIKKGFRIGIKAAARFADECAEPWIAERIRALAAPPFDAASSDPTPSHLVDLPLVGENRMAPKHTKSTDCESSAAAGVEEALRLVREFHKVILRYAGSGILHGSPPDFVAAHDALTAAVRSLADRASAAEARADDLTRLVGSALVLATLDPNQGESPAAQPDHAITNAVWTLVKEKAEAERWCVEVAEGLGYINRPEGQGGYEIADPSVIVAAHRAADARAEAAEKERDEQGEMAVGYRSSWLNEENRRFAAEASAHALRERALAEAADALKRTSFAERFLVAQWLRERAAESPPTAAPPRNPFAELAEKIANPTAAPRSFPAHHDWPEDGSHVCRRCGSVPNGSPFCAPPSDGSPAAPARDTAKEE